jgi:hypothetical protein
MAIQTFGLMFLSPPALLIGAFVWLDALPALSALPAQAAGTLQVQVTNGTPGGGAVSGLPLTLFSVDKEQSKVVATGQTDPQGAFTWYDLAPAAGASYVVSTTFQGVAYQSAPVPPPTSTLILRVFDAWPDDTAIRISKSALVILGVDPSTQIVQVLETVTLRNSGNHTFLPRTDGPRGPMGLLRFGLPAGAGNLTPDERLAASSIIQVDVGFATDLPIPPGDTDVSYSYQLPYGSLPDGGYASLNKNLAYPTDVLSVLAIEGGFTIESPELTDRGLTTLGSHRYRRFEGGSLPAQSELSLQLHKLPLILPVLRSDNPWLRGMMAIFLLLAVALPVVYAYRYKARAPSAEALVLANSESDNGRPAHRVRQIARRASTDRRSHS